MDHAPYGIPADLNKIADDLKVISGTLRGERVSFAALGDRLDQMADYLRALPARYQDIDRPDRDKRAGS